MSVLARHRRFLARGLAASGFVVAVGFALPVQAQVAGSAPFCAFDNSTGYESCHYRSFKECTWEMLAQGGYCYRNPALPPAGAVRSYAKTPRYSGQRY
jgi:hypothetical protein